MTLNYPGFSKDLKDENDQDDHIIMLVYASEPYAWFTNCDSLNSNIFKGTRAYIRNHPNIIFATATVVHVLSEHVLFNPSVLFDLPSKSDKNSTH